MRRVLPWLFLIVALWFSFFLLAATSPDNACRELSGAFDHGSKTRVSWPLEIDNGVIALRCEVTDRSTHETISNADVNWWGSITVLGGCIGAWLLGAALAGTVARRTGLIAAGASLLVATVAMAALFL